MRAPVSIEENALPTGVYVDADFTIWWGAGDAIAHLSLDGRRLESFAIDPPGSRVETTRFAVIGRTLYFAGRTPEGKSLFALPLDGPPRRSATALAVRLPEGDATWLRMAAEPLDGRELLFALPSRDVSRITVFSLEPATGRMNKRFSLPGHYLDGLAWNQSEGVLYVGAALRGPALDQGILACDLHGKRRDGSFPAATVPTPAQPTSFRGRVSLAGGALWDSGHYGYLARMDLRPAAAPGSSAAGCTRSTRSPRLWGSMATTAGSRRFCWPRTPATPVGWRNGTRRRTPFSSAGVSGPFRSSAAWPYHPRAG